MSLGEKMLAGAFSALPATALMAPVERIKCLLQIQGEEVCKRLTRVMYTPSLLVRAAALFVGHWCLCNVRVGCFRFRH